MRDNHSRSSDLFTGLKRQEAATLKWSDIELDDRLFTLTDTKRIVAHADLGRINEADPTALPKATGQKTAQSSTKVPSYLAAIPQSGCSLLPLENNTAATSTSGNVR